VANKTDLVIVESPSKAKTISKYLGPGYEVKASMGHVRDLPKSKLSVDIEGGFIPDYQPIKGKEDVIRDLKKAAKRSGKVYLATDPDREGEAISWHLKELLGIPDDKTYRVTFNEITKKVVNEAIAAPGTAEKLAEVEDQIRSGKLHVFDTSTFTIEGKALESAFALDTDGDFAADSEEAVFDGAFHESYFQSAPYFALSIDGIEWLNSAF